MRSNKNVVMYSAPWLVGFALLGCSKDSSTPSKENENVHEHPEAGKVTTESSFFVSSDKSMTGNLGGLEGADARCERLAKAADLPKHTWRAYLSVEKGENGEAVNARDRIGQGPWVNVKGVEVAADLAALHARSGDADVFVDEHGEKIPGQWAGSPPDQGVQHDILTGSAPDGSLMAGKTCADWTSEAMTDVALVGHSDGLGPNMNPNPPYNSWNSSHENGGCNDTAPRGGAGRIYCFSAD